MSFAQEMKDFIGGWTAVNDINAKNKGSGFEERRVEIAEQQQTYDEAWRDEQLAIQREQLAIQREAAARGGTGGIGGLTPYQEASLDLRTRELDLQEARDIAEFGAGSSPSVSPVAPLSFPASPAVTAPGTVAPTVVVGGGAPGGGPTNLSNPADYLDFSMGIPVARHAQGGMVRPPMVRSYAEGGVVEAETSLEDQVAAARQKAIMSDDPADVEAYRRLFMQMNAPSVSQSGDYLPSVQQPPAPREAPQAPSRAPALAADGPAMAAPSPDTGGAGLTSDLNALAQRARAPGATPADRAAYDRALSAQFSRQATARPGQPAIPATPDMPRSATGQGNINDPRPETGTAGTLPTAPVAEASPGVAAATSGDAPVGGRTATAMPLPRSPGTPDVATGAPAMSNPVLPSEVSAALPQTGETAPARAALPTGVTAPAADRPAAQPEALADTDVARAISILQRAPATEESPGAIAVPDEASAPARAGQPAAMSADATPERAIPEDARIGHPPPAMLDSTAPALAGGIHDYPIHQDIMPRMNMPSGERPYNPGNELRSAPAAPAQGDAVPSVDTTPAAGSRPIPADPRLTAGKPVGSLPARSPSAFAPGTGQMTPGMPSDGRYVPNPGDHEFRWATNVVSEASNQMLTEVAQGFEQQLRARATEPAPAPEGAIPTSPVTPPGSTPETGALPAAPDPAAAAATTDNVADILTSQNVMTNAELQAMVDAVDPNGTLPAHLHSMAMLAAAYQSFQSNPETRLNVGMQILAKQKEISQVLGTLALQAIQSGNTDAAMTLLGDAVDRFPSTHNVEFYSDPNYGVVYRVMNGEEVVEQGRMNTEQMWQLAGSVANGTAFIEQVTRQASADIENRPPAQGELLSAVTTTEAARVAAQLAFEADGNEANRAAWAQADAAAKAAMSAATSVAEPDMNAIQDAQLLGQSSFDSAVPPAPAADGPSLWERMTGGGEEAAPAPASAPAPAPAAAAGEILPAPTDPAMRVIGQQYKTPGGAIVIWRGTGWEPVSG